MAGRPSMEWFRVSTLRRLALPALVTVLGLQSLRVYYPSLAWYLRDTVGVGSITLGGIAFATFLIGFVAPLVRRVFGSRGALWFAGGGLAGLRLLEQFSTDPALDLYLSLASVALFLVFLSTFIGHTRAADGSAAPYRIAGGVIVGLALDTLVKGAAGTLDLSWNPAIGAAVVVLAIVAATLWLIAIEPTPLRTAPSDVSWSHALPLVGLGSFFLIEALIVLNQGWVAQVSGIPSTTAFAVLLLGILAMAAGAWMAFARPSLHRLPVAALASLLVFLAVPRTVELSAYLPVVVLLIQFTLGWGLGLIALRGVEPTRTGLGRTSVAITLGMLLYLLLAFVYYVSFDIALPLPRGWVVPLASLIYAACLLGSVGSLAGRAAQKDLTAVAATAGLTALGHHHRRAPVGVRTFAGALGSQRPRDDLQHPLGLRPGRPPRSRSDRPRDRRPPPGCRRPAGGVARLAHRWLRRPGRLAGPPPGDGRHLRRHRRSDLGQRHPQPGRLPGSWVGLAARRRNAAAALAMSGHMSTWDSRSRCSSSPPTSTTSPRSPVRGWPRSRSCWTSGGPPTTPC